MIKKGSLNIFLTGISKTPAFFIPILIAFWFGINKSTDVFFLVYSVVLFVTQCFCGSVRPIIVPFIAEKISKKTSCNEFVTNILIFILSSSLVVTFLYVLFSGRFFSLATDFSEDASTLAQAMSIELGPLIIIMTCSSLFAGIINAYKKFYFTAFVPIIGSSSVIITGFLLREYLGIHVLCTGYIIGQFFVLVAVFAKTGSLIGKLKFSLNFINNETLKFMKVAFFQTLAIIVWSVNPVVDNIMATYLGVGSISKLDYAYKIVHIPTSLITTGGIVVLFSYLSEIYYRQGAKKLRSYTTKIIKPVLLGVLLLIVILFFAANVTISFIYGANESIADDLLEITNVYKIYLISSLPIIIGTIFVRYHMITRNTHYILFSSLISFAANILLNYIFMRWIGVAGIALSTTSVVTIQCVILGFLFIGKSSHKSPDLKVSKYVP